MEVNNLWHQILLAFTREKKHRQTQSIIIFSWPEGFSNLGLRYRRKKRISCILALTILTVDTLTSTWHENISNFITLKTFGWNLLIGLAWWQRFNPTCKKCRNLMSDWLMLLPSKLQFGVAFCHDIIQPLASNEQSIPCYTIWRKKKHSSKKSPDTHTKARVGEQPTRAKSCLWLLKRDLNLADSEACDSPSLCFHFMSKSENHINLSNSGTFSNIILFMPFKAVICTNKFPAKIQLGFQFKFKAMSGDDKGYKESLGIVKTNEKNEKKRGFFLILKKCLNWFPKHSSHHWNLNLNI